MSEETVELGLERLLDGAREYAYAGRANSMERCLANARAYATEFTERTDPLYFSFLGKLEDVRTYGRERAQERYRLTALAHAFKGNIQGTRACLDLWEELNTQTPSGFKDYVLSVAYKCRAVSHLCAALERAKSGDIHGTRSCLKKAHHSETRANTCLPRALYTNMIRIAYSTRAERLLDLAVVHAANKDWRKANGYYGAAIKCANTVNYALPEPALEQLADCKARSQL